MTRYESLKEKLRKSEKVVGTTMIMLNAPVVLEKMVQPGLDFILMDAEHGFFDTQNVIPMLHTCRMLGMPSMMRVQDSQYHLIAKAIDMGADGVMIPRVETLEQIKTHDVVMWEKHGTVAVGTDIMDAFDQTDVLCKAANIYMCARAMGSEPDGMTAEQMKEVQDVFKLPKKRPC